MKDDPIVNEVRAVRREIERECGNAPSAYYKHLLVVQEKIADRIVVRKPGEMTLAEDGEHYGAYRRNL